MISIPKGFLVEPGIDMYTLVPPEGPLVGLIRYKERVRPLRRLGQIIREQLNATPTFQKHSLSTPERLTTREGEHAAFVELSGEEGGRPAWRFLGIVFGDDFYALTSALCTRPAQREQYRSLMRTLVLDDSLGLGWRRRRYEYRLLPGWQPFANGFVTEWLPPEYPNDSAVITAWPASPKRIPSAELFAMEVADVESAGGTLKRKPAPSAFNTATGLAGQHYSLAAERPGRSRQLYKHLIVLEDARYSYPIGLSVFNAETVGPHLEDFLETARSIVPIPESADAPSRFGPTSHWMD